MRFKSSPEDFIVEEVIRLPLGSGTAYTVYRLQKRGITTLQAQARLAAALRVPRSTVAFPALKDKEALATQYGVVRGSGPTSVEGPGFRAERIGTSARPLSPSDLLGNRFTVVLRDLSTEQAAQIPSQLAQLESCGFPNYFDQQRFGSYAPGHDWVGKRILLRDAEGALRAHLAQPFVGDPPRIRAFKSAVQQHWKEWHYLLEQAPKPSNFRSILTFLVDHPEDYRKALNLVTPRLLSLYLAAYQSLLWNCLVARFLYALQAEGVICLAGALEVADVLLPFYGEVPLPLLNELKTVLVPLFHQSMVVSNPKLAALSEEVLAEEGLQLGDLKARLLRKAYLARGTRPLLVFPREIGLGKPATDDTTPRKYKMSISFVLPPGSYATLMLKILALESSKG